MLHSLARVGNKTELGNDAAHAHFGAVLAAMKRDSQPLFSVYNTVRPSGSFAPCVTCASVASSISVSSSAKGSAVSSLLRLILGRTAVVASTRSAETTTVASSLCGMAARLPVPDSRMLPSSSSSAQAQGEAASCQCAVR